MHVPSRLKQGFTIVELLIVIVVIAILAAITIVAYNGIQKNAVESSLKSDLRNTAGVVQNDQTRDGAIPATAALANSGLGLTASGNNTLTYLPYATGFCLIASSTQANASTQYFSTRTGKVQQGTCDSLVETFAGSGVSAILDGTGTAAQFLSPTRLAFGPDGVLYVADGTGASSIIRKITPAGVVTTLTTAGSFNVIGDMKVGPDGLLYVSDGNGNRVKRVNTTTGAVTNYIGSGVAGNANGVGTAAQLDFPMGLAFDTEGNLFIMDADSYRIRKVAPDATVTTFAGSSYGYTNATGTAAQFGFSEGMGIDAANNLYVTDQDNNRIRKVTPAGVVTTYSGSGTYGFQDGASGVARFASFSQVAVDSIGMVYVADNSNNRIRKIFPDGSVTTLAGITSSGYVDGAGATSRLSNPWGVAIASDGRVFVGDTGNDRIRAISQP